VSRACMLMVLRTWWGCRKAGGEGGNVLKGGRAEGFEREVYCGSNRTEPGVTSWVRIFSVSLKAEDAVVKE
jgi:hypothetical protein